MSELPTGTVTFLFSDIEGSTKLWEQHPAAMRQALARHDAILRDAILNNHGVVFKTMGDGFYTVFANAVDALNAALMAQRALSREVWTEIGSLRVRMALHTGDAQFRDNDYFGPTLNRVARLLSAGHGEQVLLSAATLEQIAKNMFGEMNFRDLGTHWLRDLQQPERVYQLLHPSLPADFPPLRSLQTLAEDFPIPPFRLNSPQRERMVVKRLLSTTRLLTLTGAGAQSGIALQVASELSGQYADGVWLVEFSDLKDPSLLTQMIASALGIHPEADRAIIQTLVDHLKPKTLLLVLNDCDYPLSPYAQLVETLLHKCPDLNILATSREEFGVDGELTYFVPGPHLYEFIERAASNLLSLPERVASRWASSRLYRFLVGKPVAAEYMECLLLPKTLAFPVFGANAISSVAYAAQQIVLLLGAAGLWMRSRQAEYSQDTMLISAAVVVLLAIVVTSYWQTIFNYPGGGGSYTVAKENLGMLPGLVAAAALLIDYVLTVSVSIASGVWALASIPLPDWLKWLHFDHLIIWCLLWTVILMLANLRGLKVSAALFALPIYGFVFMCLLMIFIGLLSPLIGWQFHLQYVNQVYLNRSAEALSLVLISRAFAGGCSAITGIEMVSNGIPVFKQPKPQNAAQLLVMIGVIIGSLLLGLSWLAMKLHVVYWEHDGQTADAVLDQISGAVFGKTGAWSPAFYVTQIVTALLLVFAANTVFAGFPRLVSILARDGFLPGPLRNVSDKLVLSNGIGLLGLLSALPIILKGGSVDSLVPAYAVSVFVVFLLSQTGMVQHWRRHRDFGWRRRALINGIGAIITSIVLVDLVVYSFLDGAWLAIVLIVLLVFGLHRYSRDQRRRSVQRGTV